MEQLKPIIEECLTQLCKEFQLSPYQYFTESDVICALYGKLQEQFKNFEIDDSEGKKHSLIHTEYATPFRCDMEGIGFEIKAESARTKKGAKYQRGHYDLVVLNSNFVQSNPSMLIQGQNYKYVQEYLNNDPQYPLMLYGIEVMYSRSEIKPSRGDDIHKGIAGYCQKIHQDRLKIEETLKLPYCMQYCKMIAFFRETTPFMRSFVTNEFEQHPNVLLCFDTGDNLL